MAITDSEGSGGMVMPVQPMGTAQAPVMYPSTGWGGYGNDNDWLILFIILAMTGNWGGFGGFGGGGFGAGAMMGAMDSMMLWPWLMTQSVDQDVQGGFNQAATQGAIAGVQGAVTAGFGDTALGIAGINQNICRSGSEAVAAVDRAQNAITQQMYGNQIADMERSFASQTAQMQGMNAMQSQFAECCCENRLGLANLGADIAREACADRTAITEALRDVTAQGTANTNAIITMITSGIQSIKDQLCQDKIDAKNEEIARLRQELNMQTLAASQAAQTAQLVSDNAAQTQYVVNRVAPYPSPAYIVQNPNAGCGCGFNAGL